LPHYKNEVRVYIIIVVLAAFVNFLELMSFKIDGQFGLVHYQLGVFPQLTPY